ncbi:MAG TPA: GAF domain-containing protein [Leptolyngbyaceae cyanobacterium M65_K2018_010]|nr:GAF domain-containing protein [Leptolyngbyaceae cyanobacterium M65_K2018_010]
MNSRFPIRASTISLQAPHPPEDQTTAVPGQSAWVVLLSQAGVVKAVTPTGPTVLPASLATQWIGRLLSEVVAFYPAQAFLDALNQLESTPGPVQLLGHCPLGAHNVEVVWMLHPLVNPAGKLFQISAVGYWARPLDSLDLGTEPIPGWVQPGTTPPSLLPSTPGNQLQTYTPRLNQITRNVRWTLDLTIIQQQTVEGLGELFAVERCVVCSVGSEQEPTLVAAEYLGEAGLSPWRGQPLPVTEHPHLDRAAGAPGAVLSSRSTVPETAVVAVATRYQNQTNGFILLYGAAGRPWTQVELDLITDLADQVGTALAHAQLFAESNTLAIKLQQANTNLLDKQREFQEARRQAEEARHQAEEASRLKSEFLANTSHELRTPLNGIIGFLKLILDGMADDPEEQEDFLQEAHKSAIHLLELINDVLDIAKIEAGKMQIDMGPVNLRELLVDLENFARPQAELKGLYFNILLPATRDDITINGNYQRLLQVLLNLVGNANKFTHEGGVTISAEVKPQRVEYQGKTWPGIVKISVADTGIGVSLEKQDRLFQTFSQVDGERTRQYGGTGLGLAISQRLVEAMGGTVHFISMGEGLGSTVTFTTLLYQEPVMIDKEPVYSPHSSSGTT